MIENISYLIIIGIFLIYYLLVALVEKEFIVEPRHVIEKFLAVVLLFAGFSLIYFSVTGNPFLTDSINDYFIYVFVIGFIAMLWAIPTLIMEFTFFQKLRKKFRTDISRKRLAIK